MIRRDPIYFSILNALTTARTLGEETAKARKADMSEREVLRVYGSKILRRYRDIYGLPARTGKAANSRRRYLVTRLNGIRAAESITRDVLAFEDAVTERTKQTIKTQQYGRKQQVTTGI